MPKPIAERDRLRLVFDIAHQLEGMTLLDLEQTLQEVRRLVSFTSRVNTRSPEFQEQIAAFNKQYGDNYQSPTRS